MMPLAGLPGVRPAGAADLGRLAELYEQAVGELEPMRGGGVLLGLNRRDRPLPASFSRQFEDPDQFVVVGVLGTEVAGYGTCLTHALPAPDRLGVVKELYVSPGLRRQGVGSAIAGALMSWCRQHGCTAVDASALPGSRAVKSSRPAASPPAYW